MQRFVSFYSFKQTFQSYLLSYFKLAAVEALSAQTGIIMIGQFEPEKVRYTLNTCI